MKVWAVEEEDESEDEWDAQLFDAIEKARTWIIESIEEFQMLCSFETKIEHVEDTNLWECSDEHGNFIHSWEIHEREVK